jgi:cyclic nucleotide gated channel, plant
LHDFSGDDDVDACMLSLNFNPLDGRNTYVQVVGALWYLFSVQRQESCWREACRLESPSCQNLYFDCKTVSSNRTIWYEMSNITRLCTTGNGFYPFGIYAEALDTKLTSSSFTQKYFYCFWWGLKNLRYVIIKPIDRCLLVTYHNLRPIYDNNNRASKMGSCLGQNLSTSMFIGEIAFAIVIGVLGLVLFGLLIGNMQVS